LSSQSESVKIVLKKSDSGLIFCSPIDDQGCHSVMKKTPEYTLKKNRKQ